MSGDVRGSWVKGGNIGARQVLVEVLVGKKKQTPQVDLRTGEMTDWLGEGVHEFAEGINGFANDSLSWAD